MLLVILKQNHYSIIILPWTRHLLVPHSNRLPSLCLWLSCQILPNQDRSPFGRLCPLLKAPWGSHPESSPFLRLPRMPRLWKQGKLQGKPSCLPLAPPPPWGSPSGYLYPQYLSIYAWYNTYIFGVKYQRCWQRLFSSAHCIQGMSRE